MSIYRKLWSLHFSLSVIKNMAYFIYAYHLLVVYLACSKVSLSLALDLPLKAVNLGNWLVTEKWMKPSLFDGIPNNDLLVYMFTWKVLVSFIFMFAIYTYIWLIYIYIYIGICIYEMDTDLVGISCCMHLLISIFTIIQNIYTCHLSIYIYISHL